MQYKGVWTNKGLEKLAAFASGGKAVSFAQVAIGDGGGAIPEPSAAVTALAGEVWRGAINTVSQNAENTSSVLVEIVIPYNVGGFFIREWGIYDDEGDLLVYGNHAEFYKALLAEGTGAELRELIELPITNEGAVQITVSYESLASVDFVKSQIQEVLQEISEQLSDHDENKNAHAPAFQDHNKDEESHQGAIKAVNEAKAQGQIIQAANVNKATDLNIVVKQGKYYFPSGMAGANKPDFNEFILEVVQTEDGKLKQFAYDMSANQVQVRTYTGIKWLEWHQYGTPDKNKIVDLTLSTPVLNQTTDDNFTAPFDGFLTYIGVSNSTVNSNALIALFSDNTLLLGDSYIATIAVPANCYMTIPVYKGALCKVATFNMTHKFCRFIGVV